MLAGAGTILPFSVSLTPSLGLLYLFEVALRNRRDIVYPLLKTPTWNPWSLRASIPAGTGCRQTSPNFRPLEDSVFRANAHGSSIAIGSDGEAGSMPFN